MIYRPCGASSVHEAVCRLSTPRRSAGRAAARRSLSEHSFSPRAARSGFEKLTFDVLDPERHELAFSWRFDRGHCGGKFAVDSPLEEDGFEPSVPPGQSSVI